MNYLKKIPAARLFALGILILTLGLIWFSGRSSIAGLIRDQRVVFGLIIGTDWVDNSQHSDTIILARYDPVNRSLDLLSIPRDTKIEIPQMKVKRINEVFAYALRTNKKNHEIASRELCRAVQWLIFSSSEIVKADSSLPQPPPEISFYLQLDYDGFRKVVDLLGGIPVTVDEPMHYDDNWGNLHIHFEPGKYVLNGQRALEYVRFRGLSGDFGRRHRQQEFLLNIFSRVQNSLNLLKLTRLISVSIPSIKTNLNWLEKILCLYELKDLTLDNINLMQLPGKSHKGFWLSDPDGLSATAALLLSGMKSPAESASEPEQQKSPVYSKTTVEVWNASSRKDLAREVTHKLRHAGFDVIKYGNYSSRQQRTLVRDHKGETQQAKKIAALLASTRVEVFTQVENHPLVDVEVILGEDYGNEK